MPAIDDALVQHLAQLARLELDAVARAGLKSHLERMLEAFTVIEGCDTDGIQPYGAKGGGEPEGGDQVRASLTAEEALGNALRSSVGGFQVPSLRG